MLFQPRHKNIRLSDFWGKEMNSQEISGTPGSTRADLEGIINRGPAVLFLWRVAEDFPVEYVSDNVSQFGYTADDFVSGRVSWPGVTHAEDEARLRVEVEKYFAEGVEAFSQHYRLLAKSGDVRWIEDWNRVLSDADGNITHVQGIILDVTDRHELEREVLEAERREQQRIGRDLHDSLGQELTGLAFLAEALQKQAEGGGTACAEAARHIADVARTAMNHVRQIVRGLLPVGLESGGLAVALERLCETTREIHGVSCDCRYLERKHPVQDMEVAMHLFYITQEAVRNAARYADPGLITITVALKGAHGTLVVEDDGKGMDGDAMASPGLGLRIMRYRAEMINGRMIFEPRDGGGTTVTCTFTDRPANGATPPV